MGLITRIVEIRDAILSLSLGIGASAGSGEQWVNIPVLPYGLDGRTNDGYAADWTNVGLCTSVLPYGVANVNMGLQVPGGYTFRVSANGGQRYVLFSFLNNSGRTVIDRYDPGEFTYNSPAGDLFWMTSQYPFVLEMRTGTPGSSGIDVRWDSLAAAMDDIYIRLGTIVQPMKRDNGDSWLGLIFDRLGVDAGHKSLLDDLNGRLSRVIRGLGVARDAYTPDTPNVLDVLTDIANNTAAGTGGNGQGSPALDSIASSTATTASNTGLLGAIKDTLVSAADALRDGLGVGVGAISRTLVQTADAINTTASGLLNSLNAVNSSVSGPIQAAMNTVADTMGQRLDGSLSVQDRLVQLESLAANIRAAIRDESGNKAIDALMQIVQNTAAGLPATDGPPVYPGKTVRARAFGALGVISEGVALWASRGVGRLTVLTWSGGSGINVVDTADGVGTGVQSADGGEIALYVRSSAPYVSIQGVGTPATILPNQWVVIPSPGAGTFVICAPDGFEIAAWVAR